MNTRQQLLLESLLHHHDRHERLSAIVERTRTQPRFSVSERTPDHRVHGCSSNVWLIADLVDGRCRFRADADSPVVRGLVALLSDFFSDSTAGEILNANADPLELLDLDRIISPTRRHGLTAVTGAIRAFAASSTDKDGRSAPQP